jgi:hypothetical protein
LLARSWFSRASTNGAIVPNELGEAAWWSAQAACSSSTLVRFSFQADVINENWNHEFLYIKKLKQLQKDHYMYLYEVSERSVITETRLISILH